MAHENGNRKQKQMERRENFRTNALQLINEMLELSVNPSVPQELVDEGLHSIIFLAKMNKFSLEIIFSKREMLLAELKQTYPRPFELCSSQLPKRHPMSCVLEMIVRIRGEENEDDIKGGLQQLSGKLDRKGNHLISSTMCVSQKDQDPESVRYYGVSMSTSGGFSREIMIAASCCIYWDHYVADAVITYYPDKHKKPYFDGTFILPETVRCQAFRISTGAEMPPCESCGNLFGLPTAETQVFSYGNCAEVESVSNLFKSEREIKEQSQPRPDAYSVEHRQQARQSALDRLRGLLNDVDTEMFSWEELKFYPNISFEI